MTAIDILLIVGGIIIVIISYLIGESTEKEDSAVSGRELWTDKEENLIRDRISCVLADKSEDIINEADDRLCRLSNEKIMEFEEFSNEAVNTANQAHSQAVFLYKMLCEKQEEMKAFIPEIDKQLSNIRNDFGKINNSSETELINKAPEKNNKPKNISANNRKRNNRSKVKGTNKNDKILELYDSGLSIIDISKQLDIGQGEVNLVVELYRGNK